jgi:hypothetical protein
MFIFTWGDRLVVIGLTLAFVGLGAGLGYLVADRAGLITGVIISFPLTQIALLKILPKLYARRSAPRS